MKVLHLPNVRERARRRWRRCFRGQVLGTENQAKTVLNPWKQRRDMASLDTQVNRLYSSIIAVVLGGLVWVAFNSIAIYQIDWEGLPPTVSVPLVVSLVGSIVFVIGITLSLLVVSRLAKGLPA